MLKKSRVGAALATTLAGVALVGVSFSSLAATAGQHTITGGGPTDKPWLVQLDAKRGETTVRCAGTLVSREWVLTAKHCTDGVSSFRVSFPDDRQQPGVTERGYPGISAPSGDLSMVRLGRVRPLRELPKVTGGYGPKAGQAGQALGFADTADPTQAQTRVAAVQVQGAATDLEGASAIRVQGVDGAPSNGDSGAPLVVDGWIVGVLSTGSGSGPKATGTYSNLTPILNWLTQFGVTPGRNPNEPPPPPPTPETPTPPVPTGTVTPTGTVPPVPTDTVPPVPTDTVPPVPTVTVAPVPPTSDVVDDMFTLPAGEHYDSFDVLANDHVAAGARVTWTGVPSGRGLYVGTSSNGKLRVYRFSAKRGSYTFTYAVIGSDGDQQQAKVTLVLG